MLRVNKKKGAKLIDNNKKPPRYFHQITRFMRVINLEEMI